MTERKIVIHLSAIKSWAQNPPPDLDPAQLNNVLAYIHQIINTSPPPILFEGYDFDTLPSLIESGDTATLLGARAGYCLRLARIALEDSGIAVNLDLNGCLP